MLSTKNIVAKIDFSKTKRIKEQTNKIQNNIGLPIVKYLIFFVEFYR